MSTHRLETANPPSWPATPAMATVLGAVLVALMAASTPLTSLTDGSLLGNLVGMPLVAACGVVGVVVARQQPRHPMGWILLGIGIGFVLNTDVSLYLVLDYGRHHGDLPLGFVAVLLQPAWAPGVLLCGLAVLLFPDGRLPSNRLRWAVWAVIGLGALWMVGAYAIAARAIVDHNVRVESDGNLFAMDHPTGFAVWWSWLQDVFFPVLFGSWVLWLIWQVGNFRRATGDRRLQLKWLLSGAAIFVVSLPVLFAAGNGSTLLVRALEAASLCGLAALPISIGVGILKFRLYEIDRLISRTISYALLTATLAGFFVAIVTLTSDVLPFSSPVAVAASTLAAAALFNPLRLRVQHLVDRRFNRARYDAEAIVDAFGARLQDAVDLDGVRDDLLHAVHAVAPAHASVWIRPRV